MEYSGYTWLFKSPGSKTSLDDVKQTLEDLGGQKMEAWDLVLKEFSNQAELIGQMNLKSLTRLFTVNDSSLSSHIAILLGRSKRVVDR